MGNYSAAIDNLRKYLEVWPGLALGNLGYTYALSGDREKAEEVIGELQKLNNSGSIARIYTGLGDYDTALDWLEKAYDDRSISIYLKNEPERNNLRTEPRFKDILKKMGLE